ncbi:MAG TPA: homocysteine S-methyltransferase [Candidatus Limnocylindrales bacterium]|nr:homocysteine S-methyltransferase [Candidatus Limnocylindrales bacterium]
MTSAATTVAAPTILDGGLATELEARGHDLSDRLWSARLLLDDPDAIEDVHLAYFRAGALVATTASYQATVQGFAAAGLDRDAALGAIRSSVELAKRARDRFAAEAGGDSGLLVAGSVGPYGAMLADGSEYRGDYDPGDAALRDVHGPRIEALLDAGADILAIETIPTLREARVLVDLVAESGATAWLSYQCRDASTTAAGEPIQDAVAITADVPGIVAVGVNCTAPRHVPALLAAAGGATTKPLIAYPNAGDAWDARDRRWVSTDSTGGFDPTAVASWAVMGAAWLGGCCGTGPADIAALAAAATVSS